MLVEPRLRPVWPMTPAAESRKLNWHLPLIAGVSSLSSFSALRGQKSRLVQTLFDCARRMQTCNFEKGAKYLFLTPSASENGF
jgi:hypothetical protein